MNTSQPLSDKEGASQTEKSPILNNPYEEPKLHYGSINGNLDYNTILAGRRPFSLDIGITPNADPQGKMFTDDDFGSGDPDSDFINRVRTEVKKWRENGYPQVTRVTKDLLQFWFCNPDRPNHLRLFFCQREAVETAIYLNEVADRDPNIGRLLLHLLEDRQHTVSENNDYVLPRTAFKMATGTGKTVVMAMLILYNFLNKREYAQDTRFADHFLIVAPGITIRDRLAVLRIDESRRDKNQKNDYYHIRNLIPSNYERQFEGINSCLTITNYHTFEPKVFSGKKASPMDGKLVYKNGEMVKQQDKEDFSVVLNRVLGKQMKGKRLIIINDEAHHCYLPKTKESTRGKKDEETEEGEKENENAMVWYEGLRQIKNLGYKVDHVYDLSATPYYLKGSGYPEYSLFPWVVSDFGLVDAIECGLVKIPYLPSYDNTHGLDEPKLRNLYKHISSQLPKKGQKTLRKEKNEEGKETTKEFEAAPNLPALLNAALDQFTKDYESYTKELGEMGEAGNDLFTTPPVLIVVCNNTTVSKEVYKYIAGFKRDVDEQGNPINTSGHFEVFSNYTNEGLPKKKAPTLLIDSSQLEQANAIVDDEFKAVFKDEIERFKREYAIQHGAGAADNLTDGDILREVVNTVGKPDTLGSHIKCVVSVSMLTEGWDANTVTHVCGIRAFGSQLLCEQVAGRALRRCSYDLRAYDIRTGEEIDSKNIKRYKPENIVYKFPPEYARIIGVPFKTFKSGGTVPPQPPQPKTTIRAWPERKGMEIIFPNVKGYRIETKDGKITADFTNVPTFKLDFANDIAYKTAMKNAIQSGEIMMENDPEEFRDAQIVYFLTQQLISQKFNDRENGRQFQKFTQLKRIVEYWYENKLEVIGGDGNPAMKRLVKFWDSTKVVASIYEGIKNGSIEQGKENITAILDYYNPEGSTKYVFGQTSKEVCPTQHSHVNYVVADTDSWEQICAKTLEQMKSVKHYVKNSFLNFKIPYVVDGEEHDYITDFIAVCETPSGETVNLIIEISGFSNDRTGHKDAKRLYTTNYWIPAVNNLEKYGRWEFIEITDIDNIEATLNNKIKEL